MGREGLTQAIGPVIRLAVCLVITGWTGTARAWLEDFEKGTKASYSAGSVTCTMGLWQMEDALLGSLANDRFFGTKSVRVQNAGKIEMLFDKTNGVGELSVYLAKYGSDGDATVTIEYSTNEGLSWLQAASPISVHTTVLTKNSVTLNTGGAVRFRFLKSGGTRINIDDISITDYLGTVPLAAPVALTATDVATDGFTANWTEVEEATGYFLDVWRQEGVPPTTEREGFDDYPASTPTDWLIENGATKTYDTASSSGQAIPSVRLDATAQTITTRVYPASATHFSFWYKGLTASGSSLKIEASNGSEWTTLETITVLNSGTTVSYDLDPSSSYVQFKLTYTKSYGNVAVDDVTVTYSGLYNVFMVTNEPLGRVTSCLVSGLPEALFFYRVRATDGERTSDDSNVVTVETTASPPLIGAISPQTVQVGDTLTFALSIVPTGGDPVTYTNVIASAGVTGAYVLTNGVFSYTPTESDVGDRTFTFSVADDDGTNTLAVAVTVNGVPLVAPSGLASSDSLFNQFALSWDMVPAATNGYEVDVWYGSASSTSTNVDLETFFENVVNGADSICPLGWTFYAMGRNYVADGLSEVGFTSDGSAILTKTYPCPVTNLSFRILGRSTADGNALLVYGITGGATTNLLATYTKEASDSDGNPENNIFTTSASDLDKSLSLDTASNYRRFRFVYSKPGAGNVGIGNIGAKYKDAGPRHPFGWSGVIQTKGSSVVISGAKPGEIHVVSVTAVKGAERLSTLMRVAVPDAPKGTVVTIQ